ncbi:mitochondrial FAD-linked sulfhydryl oxidase [Entomortierella parvispora]|uniref:Sulfhydryl oxidase n=1 Tax=Entomortierella parvispora TaxID=205924 RepID=A0A9P3H6A2_9FUNG|nr:mitochondrial FAD-linked sulfhydryl oxidase [Entomortierella parvispora]
MPAPDHSSTSSSADTSSAASTPLPPGMVLGPDGKPCRTCTDIKSWRKIGKAAKGAKKEESTAKTASGSDSGSTATTAAAGVAGAAAAAAAASASTPAAFDYEKECPADKEILGRATWTFLHTMVAYYPDRPSIQEQSTMKSLLGSFSQFYPCGPCAEHLREEMKIDPPKVASRKELSYWMCGMHNKVNEILGKEIFDCDKVDERWRDGPADGRCD